MTDQPQACRRCSECIGEDHHWLEGEYTDTGAHGYECKHCEAATGICPEPVLVGGFLEGGGEIRQLVPCNGPICRDGLCSICWTAKDKREQAETDAKHQPKLPGVDA